MMTLKSVNLNFNSLYYFENIFFSVPKESIIDSQNPSCLISSIIIGFIFCYDTFFSSKNF